MRRVGWTVLIALAGCRLAATGMVQGEFLADTASETCDHMAAEIVNVCDDPGWVNACAGECRRVLRLEPESEQAWHDCWHVSEPTCDGMQECLDLAGFLCGPR